MQEAKKVSTSIFILAACVLGIAIGLFGLNFWHANRCSSGRSAEEIDNFINALNKRLLHAESQLTQNGILMDNLIHSLQTKLIKLENEKMEEISKSSQEEAIRIALLLASQPVPPMPEFEIAGQYKDPEKLADYLDDYFSKLGEEGYSETNPYDIYEESESSESGGQVLTDSEAAATCTGWKDKYNVVIGVSWGDLPYDLQQKWLEYSCDYHLKVAVDPPVSISEEIETIDIEDPYQGIERNGV